MDSAFERGCELVKGKKDIYLPWNGFPKNTDNFQYSDPYVQNWWTHYELTEPGRVITASVTPQAFELAAAAYDEMYPDRGWATLSQGVRKLMARNVHQIVGYDLKHPVDKVICWTKGGQKKGGTAMAIHLAQQLSIPVINLGTSAGVKWAQDKVFNVHKEIVQEIEELWKKTAGTGPIYFNSKSEQYAWLSSFHPAPITASDERVWPTLEHLYQGCKTRVHAEQEKVRMATNPGARRAGEGEDGHEPGSCQAVGQDGHCP
jgi:hypothetical protein